MRRKTPIVIREPPTPIGIGLNFKHLVKRESHHSPPEVRFVS